jgi:inhibitor of KinA
MPLHPTPRLRPQGDGAVTIEFGDEVSEAAHARVMGFMQALAAAVARGELAGVTEWVAAYSSVTVILQDTPDTTEAQAAQRDAHLLALALATQPATRVGRRWRLPVCFDADLAPDLAGLAATRGLSKETVVSQLLATRFQVYMIGFMPGFPYLGGLPESLEVPRLSSPRHAVPPRSVAVAGRMAGIYPWPSPGGWHLVGRTPVHPFDVRETEPALLRAGDEVAFWAIDRAQFEAMEAAARQAAPDRGAWLADGSD